MKKTALLIIMLLISNLSFSQMMKLSETSVKAYEDAEKRKLSRVKKITTKKFKDSLSYLNNINFEIKKIEEYDANGDVEKRYSISKKGQVYLSAEYKHDDRHRMISFIEYHEDGGTGMRFKALFEDSILIAEKRYVNYQSHDSSYCAYNKKGNPTIEVKYQDGLPKDIDIWINDDEGNPKLSKSYSFRRLNKFRFIKIWQLNDFVEYEYLSNTDYIERIYESDSTFRMKRYWKYDNQNNLLDRIEYFGKEEISTWYSYKYDCNGNELNSAVYESYDKKLSFRSENIYKNDMLQESRNYNEKNELTSIERYFYDENGINHLWVFNTIEDGKSKVGFIYSMEIKYKE